ncbi:MAG TPA: hypothetical protein VMX38_02335 [Verrucomicrobiae bacterium]|nr:hypothetical protein [Verrucomicrobiae bacterium]
MSINPVQPVPSVAERNESAGQPNDKRSAPAVSARSNPGTAPKINESPASSVTPSSEIPQDEVEVQRDSQVHGEIVVRYVDQSGNVVLQMPSEQVLGVARAINEDLQREQKVHSAAQATEESHEGGKGDGH